jgi:TolB protein
MEVDYVELQSEGHLMTQHNIAYGFLRSMGLAAALIVAGSLAAHAELHLDITKGKIEPLPIALPDFAGNAPNEVQLGRDLTQVISADLERSGLFLPIDQRAFIEKISTNQTQPRFADWRIINAQALVTGAATMQPDGRARIEFRLWDVLAEQHLTGFGYTTTPQNWRRIAHIIADQIYKRITGEDGYFDTRVVYISESGAADRRVKRLAIMDQDASHRRRMPRKSPICPTHAAVRGCSCSISIPASRRCLAIFPA